MRLDSFRVTNFRSVEDSEEVTLGDMVCLVGKNEAGKTALLQALAGLNPHPATPTVFDRERDYPRRHLNEYDARHPKEEGEAIVITSKWSLSPEDVATLAEALGPDCLRSRQITLSRRYDDETFRIDVPLNYPAIAEYLMASHGLGETVREPLAEATTTDMLRKALEALAEPTPDQIALLETIRSFPGQNAVGFVGSYIRSVTPQFMYFSYYDRMAGQIRVDDIVRNGDAPYHHPGHPHGNTHLDVGERVFLDFLEFAGTSVEEIKASTTYESLNAKCESASNAITDQLQEYWT